jgi:hypothetical protein
MTSDVYRRKGHQQRRKHATKYRNENQKTSYHQQKQGVVRCSIPEVQHNYKDSIILQK